jgi:hypothetical protein
MEVDRRKVLPLRLLPASMRGDFGSNREAFQPRKFPTDGATYGARDDILKLRTNGRRQRCG